MNQQSIDDLIIKRTVWVKSSKENHFDFDSLLSGIYNDPSHFIYEILQNAEDAGATEVSLTLNQSSLEIEHNGKDFDFNDVDGISGIGITTKKDNLNAIGKFGVGFKSVYAITQTPVIHSGSFHFEIKDFVIPSVLSNVENTKTLIILPFNHPTRSENEVFELINTKIQGIGLKTLLFLRNINRIDWLTPNSKGYYNKLITPIILAENVRKTKIYSETDNGKYAEDYIVFEKPLPNNDINLKVEIAYRVATNDKGKRFKACRLLPHRENYIFRFFDSGTI
jgi:hypothetical protein